MLLPSRSVGRLHQGEHRELPVPLPRRRPRLRRDLRLHGLLATYVYLLTQRDLELERYLPMFTY